MIFGGQLPGLWFVVKHSVLNNRARGHELAYYDDDHPELDSNLWILQNHGLVQEIT